MTESTVPNEGLRERKKRLTRQQISDTATAMFIEFGFDEVRVADVAEACGVSEKTVYNYFPTKESLLLDREDETIREVRAALGPDAPAGSPIDAVVALLIADIRSIYDERLVGTDLQHFDDMIHRFGALIESTPALRAAQRDMMDRIANVAAEAMAARAGVDPDDPEPRIAADAIMGLWGVQFRAMNKYTDGVRPPAEIRDAVEADVRRAARLIDTGLWSFGMAVQGSNGREQLRLAADSANDARRQVVKALKQAREAWRVMAQEHAHEHHGSHPHGFEGGQPGYGRPDRHALARQRQQEFRDRQQELKTAKQQLKQELKQQASREVADAKREATAAVLNSVRAARRR